MLLRTATQAHLPEVGRKLDPEIEQIMTTLVSLGGIPPRLSLGDQADFALGYYHQRAALKSSPSEEERDERESTEDDRDSATDDTGSVRAQS